MKAPHLILFELLIRVDYINPFNEPLALIKSNRTDGLYRI
jgi:hypothetical protein